MWDTEYKIQLLIDAQNVASAEITKLQKQLREVQGQASKTTGMVSQSLSSISNMLGQIKTVAVVAAIAAVGSAIKKAMDIEPIRSSFEQLSASAGIASDEMIKAMRKASAGTVSDFNLMSAANKAYSLGVVSNTEQMTTLMEIARVKGSAMWRTMNEALDDIVTGLGRGSAMILDNLGIVVNQKEAQEEYAASLGKTVEQLSEAEKKQALINKVVADGKAELEWMWDIALTFADRQNQMIASWENMQAIIGEALLPVIWKLFDQANAGLNEHQEAIKQTVELIAESLSWIIDAIWSALEFVKTIFWDVIGIFSDAMQTISWTSEEGTNAMAGNRTDLFYIISQVINFIVGIVEVGIGYIKWYWNGLKEVAQAVINDIGYIMEHGVDGIKTVFANMVSDVTNNLKKIANYAIEAINWMINQINKIPGVDLGTLDLFTVDTSGAKSAVGKIFDSLLVDPIKSAGEAGEKALDRMIDTYVTRIGQLNKSTDSLSGWGNLKTPVSSSSSSEKGGKGSKSDKNNDLIKEMNDYAKETKKIQQDLYKSIQKEADNWLANQVKNINELDKEFQKSFDKIQDKIDDTTKNIENLTKNISDLRKKLVELQVEQTQSVAKEYVKAKKEMESLEEQYKGLKEVANGVSREDLKGVGGIGKYDVDLIKKYKDYQDEMKSAYTWLSEEERKAMDEQIAYQERYRWLNNVEKIKEDYRIKKEEVQSELDAKISALNTEQETLRSLKKEQQKLQDEWIKRIDEEVLKWKEMSDKKQAFEKQYMEILEINHQKQVDMTNKLVEQWNAVYRAKMRAMSAGGGGGSNGSRASGWPVYQGNAYLVGEAWPEMFVPATNGKIVKNSDLWGGGGNISVNVNLWGVSINNGSDEKELTQKITESIVRELVLYKKGIR